MERPESPEDWPALLAAAAGEWEGALADKPHTLRLLRLALDRLAGRREGAAGRAGEPEAEVEVEADVEATPPAEPVAEASLRIGDAQAVRVTARGVIQPSRTDEMPAPRSAAVSAVDYEPDSADVDWAGLAARCRFKADAAAWQRERLELFQADEHEARRRDKEMIDAARQDGVFLWMCLPAFSGVVADVAGELAGWYAAVAEAAELVGEAEAEGTRDEQEAAMHLLGEAQAGLRAVVDEAGRRDADEDQEAAFLWLRRETKARGVFIEWLQRDAAPDTDGHADLRARIGDARRPMAQRARRRDEAARATKKVAFHAKKYADALGDAVGPPEAATPAGRELAGLYRAVAAAVGGGAVPASDATLREALRPLAGRSALPDPAEVLDDGDAARHVARALTEVGRAVARDGRAEDEDEEAGREPGPDVAAVRPLLAGRVAVLVGGDVREQSRQRLERTLGLAELRWETVAHGEPFGRVAAAIARPEVDLAITLVRFCSHRDGPAAREVCRANGKLYVECPGGYGADRLAHDILNQIGDGLRALPRAG